MTQAVQIDLRLGDLLLARGYSEPYIELPSRVQVETRVDDGDRSFFVRGAFYGMRSRRDLVDWLRGFGRKRIGEWAAVPGDFNVVVWNKRERTVTVVSDRVGAHRLYFHAADGVATVTGRLLDQARLQRHPRFDPHGIYSLLAFSYPRDPESLLIDTAVVSTGAVGCAGVDSKVKVSPYYTPVSPAGLPFESVDQAVDALDGALALVFERIVEGPATPLVMLSGGIDSLLMLKYACRMAPNAVDSLTFAIEGQHNHELQEGCLAASYFGSRHTELVIPAREILPYTQQALMDSDYPGYGAFQAIAVRNCLRRLGKPLEVCRGEDTRLPTPALDLASRAAIAIHRRGLHRNPAFRSAWSSRKLVSGRWPIRTGRNYVRHLERRTELRSSLGEYLLQEFGRFSPERSRGIDPPAWVAELRSRLDQCVSLDDIHHGLVELAYPLQYSEDMHCTIMSTEFRNCRVVFPFMAPEFVTQAARVPTTMGLRSGYVGTKNTRSRFPLVDKYVLRELIGPDAPPSLRFRRKSTAPAMDLCYEHAGPGLLLPLIGEWGEELTEHLPPESRSIVTQYREEVVQRGVAVGKDWQLGWMGLSISHLSVLAKVMADPAVDLERALESLR